MFWYFTSFPLTIVLQEIGVTFHIFWSRIQYFHVIQILQVLKSFTLTRFFVFVYDPTLHFSDYMVIRETFTIGKHLLKEIGRAVSPNMYTQQQLAVKSVII